ncbi:hypothetical protein MW334_003516 [Vibrio parahaemolyticus]|nr:hypothetical protein [Vibrio parahaemolyticus]EHR5466286.1 hypothetical protein [Vibrio parahaemolyticus]EJB8408329.1 hypothetical protein [Vibrio parahaemolyticus]ELA9712791.1 hypothetical protein [Vibrio parahaemolyticus]ELA9726299.1 hypothetical protein [Vibrio parahaemolyticus]
MSRYRRVNLDGKSITETRTMAANTKPATFVVIDDNEQFVAAVEITGRMYLVNPAYHQGLGIRDEVPANDSGAGEYVEDGRELAVLCPAGDYKKDTPITMAAGMAAIGVEGTDSIIGYSQDEVTLTEEDLIRVRFRFVAAAAAAAV